jgi:hypothetical protein
MTATPICEVPAAFTLAEAGEAMDTVRTLSCGLALASTIGPAVESSNSLQLDNDVAAWAIDALLDMRTGARRKDRLAE